MDAHSRHARRILAEIEAGKPVSQRSLARELGIALGLTNLLVRRLVRKGWIKVVAIKPNRVRYLITPAGIAKRVRMTQAYLADTVQFYAEARERIRERFHALSTECRWLNGGNGDKRVIFYGAGEVAEIGYVSLQRTDLRLVGVIDDRRKGQFFGFPIYRSDSLDHAHLDGEAFDYLVVMSFRGADKIRAKLQTLQFPADRVFWL